MRRRGRCDPSNLMNLTTYMTKIEDRPAVAAARDEVFP
jgi:hypothetical protein